MTNEDLCMMIQNGTEKQNCLEQLYVQNAGLIEKIIRHYQGMECLDDLRQESFFGIARAAELWKSEMDVPFINYAAYWIRQSVRRYIDNCGGVVRVPVDKRALIDRYHRIMNAYRLQFGRDPSAMELCYALDLSQNQLKNLKRDVHALNIRSMSEVIAGEDESLTLEDTIAAAGDPVGDVIERVYHQQLAVIIWSLVDTLPVQQKDVIRGRYKEGRTMKECGEMLGVSSECVRSLETKAMRELRTPKHARQLMPFITQSGAYTMGIRGNGYRSFNRSGSTQERAVIRIEDLTGFRLAHGGQ